MAAFPRDPLISRFPEPMSAAEARREVRRAAQLRRRVPLGHPFGVAPLWTPYVLARLVAAFVRAIEQRKISGSRPRRRGSAHRSRGRSR